MHSKLASDPPPKETMQPAIRAGLKCTKISQRELAEASGTDQASISGKLAGKTDFRLEEIPKITLLILEKIPSISKKP